MDHGLEHVVKSTLVVLPEIVRENFVAAQNVSFGLKEETYTAVLIHLIFLVRTRSLESFGKISPFRVRARTLCTPLRG